MGISKERLEEILAFKDKDICDIPKEKISSAEYPCMPPDGNQ